MRRARELMQVLSISAALIIGCSSGDDDDTTGGSGGAVGSGGMATASGGTTGSGGMAAGSGGKTGSGGSTGVSGMTGSGGMTGVSGTTGSGGMTGSGGAMATMDAGMDSGAVGGGDFSFTSPWMDGKLIDAKYRCETAPSPMIKWSNPPADTMSYAVILQDITPGFSMDFYHWVIYDIPKATTMLDEMVPIGAMPAKPAGAKQAAIWNGTLGFNGPCGPSGTNTYKLTVYALKVATLGLDASATADDVQAKIDANTSDSAEIMIMSMP
jgi:Raf kinase inhibitor-like YbhB/YbcL family protein